MGEALLRDRLAKRRIAATVRSAGLVSEGVPASPNAVKVMAKRGVDLTAHRSRLLTVDDLRRADVVIGMAREHLREAVVLEPATLTRAVTLHELVRRAEQVGPRARVDGATSLRADLEPFGDWLARLLDDRPAASLLDRDAADDVADPMGLSRRTYERTANEIQDLVERAVALGFPVPSLRSYST